MPAPRKQGRVAAMLLVVSVGGALLSACAAAAEPSTRAGSGVATSTAGTSGASYLFVVSGASGSIDGIGEDTGEEFLTVTLDANDHVTQFADRPIREAYVLSTEDLTDRWARWFAGAAPNAVLSFTEPGDATPRSIVLELDDPGYDPAAGTLTFTARHIHRQPGRSPDSVQQVELPARAAPADFTGWSLFIDSVDNGDSEAMEPLLRTVNGCVLARNAECSGDLSGGDLSGLDLAFADFSGADLSGANLRGTILTHAMLRGADLTGADITDAKLDNAYLMTATWIDGTECYSGMVGRCN